MQVEASSTVRSMPTEQRLDWATITATAVANGAMNIAASYIGASLRPIARPESQPGASKVILPSGVDRK